MSTAYRFTFTGSRGTEDQAKPEIQLSEIDLFENDGTSILRQGTIASNPAGSVVNLHQTAAKAIDKQLETKWLDGAFRANGHKSMLMLELPLAQRVASYNLWTANDVIHRDPVEWSLELRLPDGTWSVIDEQVDVAVPVERQTPYRSAGFPVASDTLDMVIGVAGSFAADAVTAAAQLTTLHVAPQAAPRPQQQLQPLRQSQPPPKQTPQALPLATTMWSSPSPPLMIAAAATISATKIAETNAPQQTLPAMLPASQHPPAKSLLEETEGGFMTLMWATIIMAVLVLVAIATINVAYIWRADIENTLKSTLSDGHYAILQSRLEMIHGAVSRVLLPEAGGTSQGGFTRVASGTASGVLPVDAPSPMPSPLARTQDGEILPAADEEAALEGWSYCRTEVITPRSDGQTA